LCPSKKARERGNEWLPHVTVQTFHIQDHQAAAGGGRRLEAAAEAAATGQQAHMKDSMAAVGLWHLMAMLFPLLAAVFFRSLLLRQDHAPSVLSEFFFILVLFLCIHMHLLIILDILLIGDAHTRIALMRIDVYAVTLFIFTVVPFFIVSAITNRVVARSILMALFAFFVNELGNSVPLMADADKPTAAMEHLVGRASFMGVTSMAAISGFGAIKAPIDYLSIFALSDAVDDRLRGPSAEERIRRKLVLLIESISAKKVRLLVNGPKADEEHDVETMEALVRDLFSEHVAIRRAQQDLQYRRATVIGRFSDGIGLFYLAYCVYKLVMSSMNIVFDRDPKTDPVTRGFELGLRLIPFADINVGFWAQFISFVLVGVLVFTSVRGFVLLTMQIFASFAAPRLSDLILLCFTFVLGLYFLSSMTLMRSNLPNEYRHILSESLGANYSFNLFHRWFDFVFVVSAGLTLLFTAFFRWRRVRLRESLKHGEPADPRLARGRGSSILVSTSSSAHQ